MRLLSSGGFQVPTPSRNSFSHIFSTPHYSLPFPLLSTLNASDTPTPKNPFLDFYSAISKQHPRGYEDPYTFPIFLKLQ